MIQIVVCSGKFKDIVSYLKPMVTEVNQMYENGLVIKKEGSEIFRGRVAILDFTGNMPGIAELMCFVGHVGTYGCRICKSKAVAPRPISSQGKYFPEKGEDRTTEELKNGDVVRKMEL